MRNTIGRLRGALRPAAVIATLLTAACGDDARSPVAPDAAPRLQIQDAARDGGAPGFYFVSPIAPTLASYPGTFDALRSPVVEICAWVNDACAGPLVARYAGATIQVNTAGQHYRVDWPTTGLSSSSMYRIRVLDGAAELGHADAKIPAPGETAAGLTAQGVVPIGNTSRLSIRFRLEVPPASASPVVTIASPSNAAVIPAGSRVTLVGQASDGEDGDLSSQIVWRSSQLAEPIGVGASVSANLPGGRHTITASVTDASGKTSTATIQLVVSIITVPATLNVPYGGSASLPITLSIPAPAGGLTLSVVSADPARVGVTVTPVVIPAGAQSINATLSGVAPGTATVAVANADYGTASSQVSTTANLNVVETSVAFAQGRSATVVIELESNGSDVAAPAGGLAVTLTPSDAACIGVPSTVTIPAGLVSTTATVTYGGTATTPCTGTVTASVAGIPAITTDAFTVTINSAPNIVVNTSGARVGAGLRYGSYQASLGAAAPTGGVPVTITSSDPSKVLVSNTTASSVGAASITLTANAGESSVSFNIHGVEGQTGTVTITASAPGYSSGSSTALVVPVVADVLGLNETTTTLTADDPFEIRLGASNAAGTGMFDEQPIRAGGTPITFTVTNSNAAVAQLTTSAGSGQSRTVTVPVGAARSPASVAAGGIALDPIGGGSTTIQAAADAVIELPTATRTVTVSAPTTSLGSVAGARVGSGLRYGSFTVSLGAPAGAGGVPVTITSADASKLLVSNTTAASVGTGSVTLTANAGESSVSFNIHGVEGQTGAVQLAATAPGYTGSSATVTVTPVVAELLGVNETTTSLTADDPIEVRVGAQNAAGTGMYDEQPIRAGGAPITFTVTSSNTAAALIRNSAGAAQSRTVVVPVGSARSPNSVAGGGVAVDAVGAGTTSIQAAADDVIELPTATRTVTVTAPTITVGSGGRVGSGLRYGSYSVSLSAPAPTATTVTLTSADPSKLRLSSAATDVGTPSVALAIAAGSSSASFYIHGMEGQTGTVGVTATAAGYTDGTTTVAVVPVALDLVGVNEATTTLSADDVIEARIGALNAAGNGMFDEQPIRAGGSALPIVIVNSNASVAQLVTSGGAAQSRIVTIPIGASRSPSTVSGGGIAIDPIGSGTTTVTALVSGVTSLPTASRTVTVSAPGMTISSGMRVGSGLRYGSYNVTLGAPAGPGGVEVTLSSSTDAVLRVSPIVASAVGTGSVTLTVAAGTSSASFYIHGMEGQTGTVTLTATAPGYTNGTGTAVVAAPAIEIAGLTSSMSASAANDPFEVRLGALNAAGTSLFDEQVVRPGGTPITVTVTNGNAAVADLVTTAGAAQSRTVTIGVGAGRSATTVATGGVAFAPRAAGSTTVQLSAPGVVTVSTGTQTVTVTP